MSCEKYQAALTEAAATSAAPAIELRTHLEICTVCRARFAEVETLFAAIDAGLSTVANAPTPPSLIPRACSLLEQEQSPQFNWIPVWATIGVASSVLAMTLALLLGRDKLPGGQPLQAFEESQNQVSKPAALQTPAAVERRIAINRSIRHSPQDHVAGTVPPRDLREPEVLVSSGERVGFALLVSAVQRKEVALALAAPSASEKLFVQVDSVQVGRLAIVPLAERAN